jgi:hypothetical protein
MRWFRRHRGSQSEAPTPNYQMHIVAPDADPAEMARIFAAAFTGRRPPSPNAVALTVCCSCGTDTSPPVMVEPGRGAQTVHVTCTGCGDTVGVTYKAADE